MVHIMLSFCLFILSVFLHIIRCRMSKKDVLHIKTFFNISAGAILAYLYLDPIVVAWPIFPSSQLWHAPMVTSSLCLFILCIPTYLIFYFSINVESPSRLILNEIEKNGRMTFEELTQVLTDEKMIAPRIDDLMRSKYIVEEGKGYRLTPIARKTAKNLAVYQFLSGRKIGG